MVRIHTSLIGFSVGIIAASLAAACGGDTEKGSPFGGSAGQVVNVGDSGSGSDSGGTGSGATGSGATGSGATGSGATGSGATGSGTAGSGATGSTLPDGACNNGVDDDGDGAIDGFDPECTGAADDDEGTFATGIPGDNRDPKWQDCFFDGNSGAGDDGCRYHTDCLYGTIDQSDGNCQLTDQCVDFCRQLTPNGCDCFGCCTVQGRDGTNVDILMQPACSLDAIDDQQACPRCTKSTSCENTCGRCELCPGKTAADLPDDCTPDTPPPDGGTPPPGYTCEGATVCSDTAPCEGGFYCLQGCCRVVLR